jgi:hypothetical protein
VTTATLAALLAIGLAAGTVPSEPAPACGWPDRIQRQALSQATRLMPDSLRRILRRHRRAVNAGARQARRTAEAAGGAHAQGLAQQDGAARRLAESMARVTALIDAHASMKEIAREMGIASHFVADLSNPFRTAPRDEAASSYAGRFADYMDENLPRLRIVFEGYTDPLLEAGEYIAFGHHLADRSRSYLDELVGSFRRFDDTGDPLWVDERSVPFGVASLSFSRTVTDTARVWLQSWRRAHGDLTGLPYPLEEKPEGEHGMAVKGSS